MKYDFLQSDFSGGEISPRAQGHVDSPAYKAGLSLAANCAPTRAGSIASRAGGRHVADGVTGAGLPSNMPVQHLNIQDGPTGDFIVEVSPTGIRLMDKTGVLPWDFAPSATFLQYNVQDGAHAYGDSEGSVYLRSEVASGSRHYVVTANIIGGLVNALDLVGVPVGTNNTWIFSGRIAGDNVTAHIVQANPAHTQDIAIVMAVDGTFSITFRPNVGGADEGFYIELRTGAGTTATVLWDLQLTKHNVKVVQDTSAAIAPPTLFGAPVAPSQERIRHASFWAQGDFWVAFAGGAGNAYASFGLRWHGSAVTPTLGVWTFGTLPCTPSSLTQIQGASTVTVFQDRLWYGINLASGKKVIRASVVGFGKPWGLAPQAGSTGNPTTLTHIGLPVPHVNTINWLFQFIVETETFVTYLNQESLEYHFPCDTPKSELIIKVTDPITPSFFPQEDVLGTLLTAVVTDPASPFLGSPDWIGAGGLSYRSYTAANLGGFPYVSQDAAPGGFVLLQPVTQSLGVGIAAGLTYKVTRVALGDDPLDLDLASPAGKIAWLNVLRGLILGTSRNEKLFSQSTALSVDPATGQFFDVQDESSHGADPALPALDVNDRVLFVQRGRKVLRLAGISITSDGGLVSDDVGVAGEHLTNKKVRSMCFLKSPVQRAVFAFDDGTGAVMTLVGKSAAFSRLSIPAVYGGIYSVTGLDGPEDSELWIGTENGCTLWAKTFESDIVVKQVSTPNAVPLAPTRVSYDTETPLPPVMDGWSRLPLINQGGVQYVLCPSTVIRGASAYALIRGQVQGPFVVDGTGRIILTSLGLDVTWVDESGARRATEVYVGMAYPTHRWTSLPLEGGDPTGTSQNNKSRKPQLYLRFVDSYMPKVNGTAAAERGPTDKMDLLGVRVTGDRRATELNFQRAAVVDVVMESPLRMEVAAIFGGVAMNNV